MPVALLTLLLLISPQAFAERAAFTVEVADAYLELHTGPGRGYPITDVVERGEVIEIRKRRTSWYKIQTEDGRTGWVSEDQIERTLGNDGETVALERPDFDSFEKRRWEAGVMGGDFGGANMLSVFGAYGFSPNLSVELQLGQALGAFSESRLMSAHIVHQLLPEKRFSPFFTLGTGVIKTEPKATLVQTEDREDQFAMAGAGMRAYLTRRFLFRAEFKSYVVLTSRNENDEINEWKAGFTFFF